MKIIFKTALLTSVFCSLFFVVNFCSAIDKPSNLVIKCGDGGPDSCSWSPEVSWTNITGATEYWGQVLQYSENCSSLTGEEGSWENKMSDHPRGSPSNFSGLAPDTRYCWGVMALGSGGWTDLAVAPDGFKTHPKDPDLCPDGTTPPCPCTGPGCNPIFGSIDLKNPLKADNLEDAFTALLNFLFYLAVALTPVLIIYAAFLLATAHGDPKQITKANTIITWTIAALAIVLLAKGIPSAVKGIFGAK